MPTDDKQGNSQPGQGAVPLLSHSEDNRLGASKADAVDMKLPASFEALIAELERVDEVQRR